MAYLVTKYLYCITVLLERILAEGVTFFGELSHNSFIFYFAKQSCTMSFLAHDKDLC